MGGGWSEEIKYNKTLKLLNWSTKSFCLSNNATDFVKNFRISMISICIIFSCSILNQNENIIRRVSLVKQELLRSSSCKVFCVIFCRQLFILLSFAHCIVWAALVSKAEVSSENQCTGHKPYTNVWVVIYTLVILECSYCWKES